MTIINDTSTLRTGLTDHLRDVLTAPLWRNAFQSVPRHLFAPRFAIHNPDSTFTHHDIADPDVQGSSY